MQYIVNQNSLLAKVLDREQKLYFEWIKKQRLEKYYKLKKEYNADNR